MVSSSSQKPKKEIQVVKCPSAFPISSKPAKKRPLPDKPSKNKETTWGRKKKDPSLLDWHDTVKEVRSFGAEAFEGKQKRDFQDEKYFRLTGRHKKKPQTPLPIVRGLKKAAAIREAKAREEARQAGIILPKAKKEIKKSDTTYRNYGPAPNIGFMKDGMYRVKGKDNRKR
jgi:Domain of unknown function (DUF4602)